MYRNCTATVVMKMLQNYSIKKHSVTFVAKTVTERA